MIAEEVAAHPWVARAAECVRFGISTAPQHDWDATKAFAQAVEAMGFDALVLPEHPMFVGNATWTALCGLAEVTHTVRLGTLVSCVSYSNPAVLARMATDLDRMSGGRAILGLGSGDMPHEFRQLGVPWRPAAERQAALEEGLQIIRPLLQGRRVTFRGQYFHVEDAVLEPPPMQQPGYRFSWPAGAKRRPCASLHPMRTGSMWVPRRGRAAPSALRTSAASLMSWTSMAWRLNALQAQ